MAKFNYCARSQGFAGCKVTCVPREGCHAWTGEREPRSCVCAEEMGQLEWVQAGHPITAASFSRKSLLWLKRLPEVPGLVQCPPGGPKGQQKDPYRVQYLCACRSLCSGEYQTPPLGQSTDCPQKFPSKEAERACGGPPPRRPPVTPPPLRTPPCRAQLVLPPLLTDSGSTVSALGARSQKVEGTSPSHPRLREPPSIREDTWQAA